MFRFTIATAATALLLSPAFAQTTTETAEEILNDSADTVLEETDATPVEGAPDCDNPTAEEANDDADTATDEIECPSAVSGEPDAGEEEFERLDEEDDEGVEIDE